MYLYLCEFEIHGMKRCFFISVAESRRHREERQQVSKLGENVRRRASSRNNRFRNVSLIDPPPAFCRSDDPLLSNKQCDRRSNYGRVVRDNSIVSNNRRGESQPDRSSIDDPRPRDRSAHNNYYFQYYISWLFDEATKRSKR